MRLANSTWAGIFAVILGIVLTNTAFAAESYSSGVEIVETPTDGGIREDVPKKYRAKFERWKSELLSTEFGRQQWYSYANNKQFVLIIKVAGDKGKGAGTDKYQWDHEGRFVGATITLGSGLDDGYPTAIYYPVLNSLSNEQTRYQISGILLAATKMSHEIGHVIQTANSNKDLIQTQYELIPEYAQIFLTNGRNPRDGRLIQLAERLGGTPIEIWETHEYLSEVNAMRFLEEKITGEAYYCYVFNRIRYNVDTYARAYSKLFDPAPAPCVK